MKKFMFWFSPCVLMPFATMVSCNSTSNNEEILTSTDVKIATFNISFATDNDNSEHYQRWYDYLHLNNEQQNNLIQKWIAANGIVSENLSAEEKELTERIMQIRNIAAIIQKNRPAILSLNEFNNDGYGNNEIIKLFQDNYLAHGQSLNGFRGGDVQEPIFYPYYESFATNTGLISGYDLDNDGVVGDDASTSPYDAYGFGYYHGHYAIAVMSQYELDLEHMRTFQEFKYADMRDENNQLLDINSVKVVKNSTVKKYDDQGNLTNEVWTKDDAWYTEEEWNNIRLSSKNHIDLPVNVNGKIIHLLLSHPTPPNFNEINGVSTNVATERNKNELLFWKHYINNASWIYDDQGNFGGLGDNQNFVILGDLNADSYETTNTDANIEPNGNAYSHGIRLLIDDSKINQNVLNFESLVPTSQGAYDAYSGVGNKDWQINNYYNHPMIEAITTTFGLKADWIIPNKELEAVNSGVYWVGQNEVGHYLFVDTWGDKIVKTKEVSSDHRLVWLDLKI